MSDVPTQGASVQFLGAAGTVTGSMHLVRAGDRRVLLDSGLFQGLKELRSRNRTTRVADPGALDAVVLSHAHIDHTGYLPALVRQGFLGPVYCTSATAELLRVMLPDSARLQEEEAERANRHGYSKHRPALPLYTVRDADAALRLLRECPTGEPFSVTDGIGATFRRAGHILGAASVELELSAERTRKLVFSGDLGRWGRPVLHDPELVPEADVLLLESTYGDRAHATNGEAELERIVNQAASRGGALLIPAFAVGRAQELIWWLDRLERSGRIPSLPLYIDSPMAIDVTDIYTGHLEDLDTELRPRAGTGGHLLGTKQCTLARTAAESKRLNEIEGPVIIIAASGMVTGGRILHHLSVRLPDPRTTVLLVGFQADGTRGRALREGARTVRIFGRDVAVGAAVETLDALSAHADREELLRWLGGFQRPPRRTYLVHGEPPAAASLAEAIRARFGWTVAVAQDRETVEV
ncbi:MAG: MBL fold metallo-hydrolase [Longimicrobiales bacterium]